jgi:hypothetical protein
VTDEATTTLLQPTPAGRTSEAPTGVLAALPGATNDHPDFIVIRSGDKWLAFHRHENWCVRFVKGEGADPELAIADLVRRYPKEAA